MSFDFKVIVQINIDCLYFFDFTYFSNIFNVD